MISPAVKVNVPATVVAEPSVMPPPLIVRLLTLFVNTGVISDALLNTTVAALLLASITPVVRVIEDPE